MRTDVMRNHHVHHEDADKSIVRTPQQARQAERGPTVLNVLIISTVLAAVGLAITWWVMTPSM